MLKFEDGFKFHTKIARFKRFGVPDSKYTSDVQYWNEFVSRWHHHTDLTFEDVIPTEEQKARLAEVADISESYLGDASLYVEWGAVDVECDCPQLQSKKDDPEVVAATLEYNKSKIVSDVRLLKKEKELAGVGHNGLTLRTDSKSQARVGNMATTLMVDESVTDIDFEIREGEWIKPSREEALEIAKAISKHVQKCFTHSKELQEQVAACKSLEELEAVDITLGW